MLALLVYAAILALAAAVTFALFGEAAEADVAATDALDFFAAAPTAEPPLPPASPSSTAAATTSTHAANAAGAGDAAQGGAAAHIQALLDKSGVPPQQQEMISFLGKHCCVLPVESHTVKVLTHPTTFYEELKARVMAAQRSITLSALYIGDGPLSKSFVACLEERVRWAAAGGHTFTVTILLDYNRMQDRKNLVTLKTLMELAQQTASTASLPGTDDRPAAAAAAALKSAESPTHASPSPSSSTFTGSSESDELDDGGVRVRLFLYQNPSRWNRLFAPFGRAKEVLGVQHTKIFVFDQRHTVLTGANLSDDYFATRMDRYMMVQDNPMVARWFSRLVRTVNAVSHPVVCRKEFAESYCNGTNADGSSSSNAGGSRGASPTTSPKRRPGSPTLHRKSDLVILPNALGMDPSVETRAFCARMNELLHEFAAWARRMCAADAIDWAKYDTFLYPTLQVGRAGVQHDSVMVKQLLRLATSEDHIFLTSPYLNMYASFVDEVLRGAGHVDCITASVQTNGWSGHRGMAGRIPLFYLQLERSFYYLMKAYNCLDRVRIREFSVKGLTFHAKGLWFAGRRAVKPDGAHDAAAPAGDVCESDSISAPYLVAYGSTNYGYRSVHKDVEAEAFLLTTNDALRETLRQELLFLLTQSVSVAEAQFVGTAMGRFQPVVSLMAHLGQDFL